MVSSEYRAFRKYRCSVLSEPRGTTAGCCRIFRTIFRTPCVVRRCRCRLEERFLHRQCPRSHSLYSFSFTLYTEWCHLLRVGLTNATLEANRCAIGTEWNAIAGRHGLRYILRDLEADKTAEWRGFRHCVRFPRCLQSRSMTSSLRRFISPQIKQHASKATRAAVRTSSRSESMLGAWPMCVATKSLSFDFVLFRLRHCGVTLRR